MLPPSMHAGAYGEILLTQSFLQRFLWCCRSVVEWLVNHLLLENTLRKSSPYMFSAEV